MPCAPAPLFCAETNYRRVAAAQLKRLARNTFEGAGPKVLTFTIARKRFRAALSANGSGA